ncbi:MAG: hypothetical protein HYX22_02485 [Candidatus Yanofskybacteria bacterium]|nr:hypothetical protein [Candidatus Yanofskybacteria bacterium]
MNKNLSKQYSDFLDRDEDYQDALKIAKLNSKGKIWLIGGFVFRNLSNIIYSPNKQDSDIDILISDSPKEFKTMRSWKINKNRYGNPKFVKSGKTIDLIPLKTVSPIKRLGLKPTIYNYLKHVPFNIQSIAFDISKNKLVGNDGMVSLMSKKIFVKDKDQAKIYLNKKGLSAKEWISKKKRELNF